MSVICWVLFVSCMKATGVLLVILGSWQIVELIRCGKALPFFGNPGDGKPWWK